MFNKLVGFVFLFILLFGSYSCEKKIGKIEQAPVKPPDQELTKVNGIFFLGRGYKVIGSELTGYSLQLHAPGVSAVFSDSLCDISNFYPSADVGEVKVNDVPLGKALLENTLYYYTDNTTAKSAFWEVSGNLNFESFSFSDNKAYPLYNDFFLIPDSIVIAENNVISVEGFEGQKVVLTIFCETTVKQLVRAIAQPIQSFQLKDFTLTDLIKDYKRLPVSLRLDFYNDDYLRVGKRWYLFRRGYTLTKEHVILSTKN